MSKISQRIDRDNKSVFGEAGQELSLLDSLDEIRGLLGIDNIDNIRGVPLNVSSLNNNDVLRYSGSATEWANINQTVITDGGNF